MRGEFKNLLSNLGSALSWEEFSAEFAVDMVGELIFAPEVGRAR